MGKGSYLGGHTILGRYSDWFSGYSSRTSGSKTAENTGSRKKIQPVNASKIERDYIHQVAHAIANSNQIPRIPKKIRKQIEPVVKKLGGIEAWARSRENFDAILKNKKKKVLNSSGDRQLRSPSASSAQVTARQNIEDVSKEENLKRWVEDLNTQIRNLNKELQSINSHDKSKVQGIARKIEIIANKIAHL